MLFNLAVSFILNALKVVVKNEAKKELYKEKLLVIANEIINVYGEDAVFASR